MSFSFHPNPYIYIYTHTHNTFCYSIIELHHPLIFYLFFSFLNFSSHYSLQQNKNKNKNLFFCLLVHTYSYTSSNLFLPSLLFYFPHYFLIHRYTSFIIFHNLTLLLPILFVHAYSYTSSNLSLSSHYSLLHHYTSFIIFSFL